MSPGWTRRAVLASALVGSAEAHARRSRVPAGARETLSFLLDVERVNADYYTHALRELRLSPPVRALVGALRFQERRHVAAVENALRRAGGALPNRFRQRLPATTQEAFIEEAIALEDVVAGAWAEACPALRGTGLLDTAGSLVAVEGRHAALLRVAAGLEPVVPEATVTPLTRRFVRDELSDLTIPRAEEQPPSG